MMMHIPMATEPTRIASATFLSCTTSRHKWYGVILSMITKDSAKITMPRSEYTRALARACVSITSLSSYVARIEAIVGAIRAGIVANRLGHVLHLVDPVEGPALVFGPGGPGEQQHAVNQIAGIAHSSALSSVA